MLCRAGEESRPLALALSAALKPNYHIEEERGPVCIQGSLSAGAPYGCKQRGSEAILGDVLKKTAGIHPNEEKQ